MTELFFIRHAATDLAGTFCGHADPPVNRSGEEQIGELLTRLRGEPFHRVISSDLQRAKQTALPLAHTLRLPLTTDAALREIGFGAWEALRWEEIEARDPAFATQWVEAFPKLTPPGGEPFSAFRERVMQTVTAIAARHDSERIAIVTHGGVMRLILQELLGIGASDAWQRTKLYCSTFSYLPYRVREEQHA